ncbi:lipid droplet-regulating VLDL assembly factor AUP1 [Bombina bombina]|uniref:lipid droplet-regulating VLDL assembly factor AUP1 n=1 Tax=Bombina bombina TaxID=8345 RepID=UPI00235A6EA7|nr:lipid droplet-regulating VLDL assembly factor AUP1 [Bombina bombina]
MMEPPGLSAVLELQRFPMDHVSLVLLLLYSPIGLCLFILRLFIGAHVFLVSCGLPDCMVKRSVIRVMSSVLGVFVTQTGQQYRDQTSKICICNHRTHFDHSVISLITPCSTPSLSCAPGFLCWARGFLELGSPGSRTQLQESLKHYLSQPSNAPLLLFPEEETTSGRTALLNFSSWPFSLSDTVQPLTLRVQRPLISPAVSDGHWVTELFWTFFIPFTVYQVRWLPPVSRLPRESDEDLASRAQQLVARSLGIACTNHTAADRAEYLKRRSTEPATTAPQAPYISPSERHMAERVKEVLPHVPLSVIYRDLASTGCVDATITNLLEGRVPFIREEGTSRGMNPSSEHPEATQTSRTVRRGFGRRPEDRHLSLQERKTALYEYARSRYLEKFGSRTQENSGVKG